MMRWVCDYCEHANYESDICWYCGMRCRGDEANIDSPPHYTSHESGIECIQVTEHMNFCLGNVVKYVWRVDQKGDPIENLKKARFYINREIERRRRG